MDLPIIGDLPPKKKQKHGQEIFAKTRTRG
jgi:hypothetical protein